MLIRVNEAEGSTSFIEYIELSQLSITYTMLMMKSREKLLMRHLLKEHLLIAVVKTFQKVRSLTTKQL